MNKILLGLAAAASIAYARLFGGSIDGTAWDVKIKADSLIAFSHRGTLSFDKGRLNAALPLASGFGSGDYQSQSVSTPGGTVWTAALSEASQGVLSWQGIILGDEIQGIAVHWRPDGKPERFLFKGTRHGA